MSADRVYVGYLDITVLSRYITLDVSRYSTGKLEYVSRYGANVGSWSCSLKEAIGTGTPRAFPVAKTFTSSNIIVPTTGVCDLSGTDTVVFTTDVVGSAGTVDIWAILKT